MAVGRQAFDGRDFMSTCLDGQHKTGVYRLAVEQHRTRAAFAFRAAVLGAGQHKLIAQHLQKRMVRLDSDVLDLTVDRKTDFVSHSEPRAKQSDER